MSNEPRVDALRYALEEEDELIVNALDRLDATGLRDFSDVLGRLSETVRRAMKRRGVDPLVRLTFSADGGEAADYLVWSNQHGMWWRGGERGYTSVIEEAGRYTKAHADAIVAKATCNGALKHERINPVTGIRYESFDEVAVPAPVRIETEDVPF